MEPFLNTWRAAIYLRDTLRGFGTPIAGDVPIHPAPLLDMEAHYFDMPTTDGRVYRVRVSDITPADGG